MKEFSGMIVTRGYKKNRKKTSAPASTFPRMTVLALPAASAPTAAALSTMGTAAAAAAAFAVPPARLSFYGFLCSAPKPTLPLRYGLLSEVLRLLLSQEGLVVHLYLGELSSLLRVHDIPCSPHPGWSTSRGEPCH